MSLTFSISAPQNVTLPSGRVISFRVNAQDTSLVEMHIPDTDGTHILTFKRNGGAQDQTFVGRPETPKPLAGYKSVDDDAVRDQPKKPEPIASKPERFETASPAKPVDEQIAT